MGKEKHTPGPWKAHLNVPTAVIEGHIIKVDDEIGCPIASLWVGGGTEGKPRQIANAHLIAAAPDMLEALEALINDVHQSSDGTWNIGPMDRSEGGKMSLAKAAIAKAKGK